MRSRSSSAEPGAALETSFGNGGVIHASEVEPWSQPGMPRKILKWLGKEDAPLLVRYGAIPHMWRWGLKFVANCTPERFRAQHADQSAAGAAQPARSLQEIRAETGDRLRPAHRRRAEDLHRAADPSTRGLARPSPVRPRACVFEPRRSPRNASAGAGLGRPPSGSLVGGIYFARDEVGDCHKFTTGLAARCAELGVNFHYGTSILSGSERGTTGSRRCATSARRDGGG